MTPRTRDTLLVIYLLLQIALPLRYYLRADEPGAAYDERFAWRMFSPIRMLRCKADYRLKGAAIDLEDEVHSAWITLVERGRMDAIRAVDKELCKELGGPITAVIQCKEIGGRTQLLYDGKINVCTGGAP